MAAIRLVFRYEDRGLAYQARLASAFDKAIEHMIIDVDRIAVTQAPVDTGNLVNSRRQRRVGPAHWELSFNTPYARRWHYEYPKTWKEKPPTEQQRKAFFAKLGEGRVNPSMGGGRFQHGRKTHYLERPGTTVGKRAANYVSSQMKMAGLA